jgi:hypothetical protein
MENELKIEKTTYQESEVIALETYCSIGSVIAKLMQEGYDLDSAQSIVQQALIDYREGLE